MASVSRPFPITVVALLAGLMALAGIAFGALGIAGGAGAYGVASLVVGVIYFLCAYGLWSLKGWAWMLSVIAQLLNIVTALVPLASKGSVVWVQLVVAVLILLYLNSGGVKRAFGR
jgi:lysylphosphatidylglycerol synthetase-like protein (DUF2156 family)